MSSRKRPLATAGVLVALALLAIGWSTVTARAATMAGVPQGVTQNGNLTVNGQTATVAGTVTGDVSVQGKANLVVSGHVDGSIRAYGNSSVTLQRGAHIGGGLMQSTGSLSVAPGATIGGNVETYDLTQPASVDGTVQGNLRVSASGLQLASGATVGGNVTVWASSSQPVSVDGTIQGQLHVYGTKPQLGPSAHVRGSATNTSSSHSAVPGVPGTLNLVWPVGVAIVLIALVWATIVLVRRVRRRPSPPAGA